MHYYNISIIGSPLETFTYHSLKTINIASKVSLNFRNRDANGVIISVCEKPEFQTNEILEVSEFFYSIKQIDLARFISRYYFSSLGEAIGLMVPFKDEVSCELENEKIISKLLLSPKQEKALEFLQEHKVSLLFGDTGSGKTEIYMKYFEQMIAEGKRSIFLMPEISLTPQMSKRLEEHFGESVVMWHSKLTPLQRKRRWLRFIVVKP